VINLWDSDCYQLSINKLMIKAYGFALAKTNDSSATEKWFDLVDAKIFYLDKDGDAITISSNEELTDLIKASPRANK
jgi:ABC-type amino acid transport substrate-binding protein